jgi:DNA polymerase III delta subunit
LILLTDKLLLDKNTKQTKSKKPSSSQPALFGEGIFDSEVKIQDDLSNSEIKKTKIVSTKIESSKTKSVKKNLVLGKQEIYLLSGDDSFRLQIELKRIKQEIIQDWNTAQDGQSHTENLGLVIDNEISVLQASSNNDLQSTIFGVSLFHSKKLVLIDLADFEAEDIIALLECDEIPDFIKVIFYYRGKLDKRQKLYKFLESVSIRVVEVEQFSSWKTADIANWAKAQAAALQVKIDHNAVDKLVELNGNNSALIFSELQKLQCFAENNPIKLKDVEDLCKPHNDVFDLVNYLLVGNLQIFSRKIKEISLFQHPLELIRAMQTIFRGFLQIKSLQASDIQSAEIARLTGKNPWKTNQDLIKLSKVKIEKLSAIYKMLGQIESEIKSGQAFDPVTHMRFRAMSLVAGF